jgi:zinc transport system substrate-binding protein
MRSYLLALLLLLSSPLVAEERLKVAVSIIPQKNLVERIGGELVDVQLIVQPGQSPATYEPTPRQMADVSQADIYYRIGVPFEHVWLERIQSAYPNLPILDARAGIELRAMDEGDHHHDHGHDHGEDGLDPHIWLSPPLIKIMAQSLRDRLIKLLPKQRDILIKNHAAFLQSLDSLDSDIRAALAGAKVKKFMVYHPSWGYFADTYGLQQIPIESEGKEPGAKALARLIAEAKENRIGAIFVQKQFSQDQAKAVASSVGAKVVAIDPLSADYPENLRDVAQAMAESSKAAE